MYLKRFYKNPEEIRDAPEGEKQTVAKLDYISLGHTGHSPEQNFSTSLVVEMLTAGIMEIHDSELFFKVHPETLRYTTKRVPGKYCCHCGEKLPDDAAGDMARLHVATKHAGHTSPSKANPAGYEAIHYYECVLDAKQHAEFKKKAGEAATRFPVKES